MPSALPQFSLWTFTEEKRVSMRERRRIEKNAVSTAPRPAESASYATRCRSRTRAPAETTPKS